MPSILSLNDTRSRERGPCTKQAGKAHAHPVDEAMLCLEHQLRLSSSYTKQSAKQNETAKQPVFGCSSVSSLDAGLLVVAAKYR